MSETAAIVTIHSARKMTPSGRKSVAARKRERRKGRRNKGELT